MKALVDNDVILKCARYGLLDLLIEKIPPMEDAVGILGSARYVLPDVIRRNPVSDPHALVARVLGFIDKHEVLEPTQEELSLAADLESCAQTSNLPLDPGESLLCAMLILRPVPLLITGDKRAIAAIEQIGTQNSKMRQVDGRVRCLEQLVLAALTAETVDAIRSAICACPDIDKALFNCCGCYSAASDLEGIIQGLDSYIRALRMTAPRTLCP